jgi:hypothetical protein
MLKKLPLAPKESTNFFIRRAAVAWPFADSQMAA